MERWQTGGSEYYLKFNKGLHELREVTDEETGDYKVITSGHFQQCHEVMNGIIVDNFDYDHNL